MSDFIMKIQVVFRNAVVVLLGASAMVVVGCGGGEDASTSSAPPVRGEPIQVTEVRGEPIGEGAENIAESATRAESESPESGKATGESTAAEAVVMATEKVESAVEALSKPGPEAGKQEVAETAEAPAPKAEKVVGPMEGPEPPPAVKTADATAAAKPAESENAKAADDPKPEIIKSGGEEYAQVTFDHLASFEYEMPDEFGEVDAAGDDTSVEAEPAAATAEPAAKPEEKDQIPANVRKFNNTRVALEGFMLPLKVEDSLVTEMLIMRDQSMCCFGSVPKINEWVSIRMTGKGVKPVMDEPVTIYGKLKVGEIRENGYLVGIYEMDGERMGARIDF